MLESQRSQRTRSRPASLCDLRNLCGQVLRRNAALFCWQASTPMDHNHGMHISQMARSAGVNVQTVRFYERQRLLRKPLRNAAGYRCYEPSDVERISFIKTSQALGFTLSEIKELIELHKAVAGA